MKRIPVQDVKVGMYLLNIGHVDHFTIFPGGQFVRLRVTTGPVHSAAFYIYDFGFKVWIDELESKVKT